MAYSMSRKRRIFLGLIIPLQLFEVQAQGECFYPSGDLADQQPCDPFADISLCCPVGWTCFSSNVCVAMDETILGSSVPLGTTQRGGCTDPEWNDDVCGTYCLSDPDAASTLQSCGDGSWCCQSGLTAGTCDCSTGQGTFTIPDRDAQTIIGVSGPLNTTISTSVAGSAAATSTILSSRAGPSPGIGSSTLPSSAFLSSTFSSTLASSISSSSIFLSSTLSSSSFTSSMLKSLVLASSASSSSKPTSSTLTSSIPASSISGSSKFTSSTLGSSTLASSTLGFSTLISSTLATSTSASSTLVSSTLSLTTSSISSSTSSRGTSSSQTKSSRTSSHFIYVSPTSSSLLPGPTTSSVPITQTTRFKESVGAVSAVLGVIMTGIAASFVYRRWKERRGFKEAAQYDNDDDSEFFRIQERRTNVPTIRLDTPSQFDRPVADYAMLRVATPDDVARAQNRSRYSALPAFDPYRPPPPEPSEAF